MEAPGSDQHQAHYTVTVSIDQNYLLALDNENTEACIVCGDRASGQSIYSVLQAVICYPHIIRTTLRRHQLRGMQGILQEIHPQGDWVQVSGPRRLSSQQE